MACDHDCSHCGSDCSDRKAESLIAKENAKSDVKRVIAVVSGKGGVGKSMVSALLTTAMRRRGFSTAVLDADITGPSMPQAFGVKGMVYATDDGIIPAQTAAGTKLMSINLMLPDDTDPVVWRGPIIAGTVTQFWTDVCWGDVDYMFVDMPPGTGDVPLTVFQQLPVDGIIGVTSPQELVGMIVGKAVKMANMLNVPLLGIVENMSYFECPDCHAQHRIFGESHIEELAAKYGIDTVARLPIDPSLAALCDEGRIESFEGGWLDEMADMLCRVQPRDKDAKPE